MLNPLDTYYANLPEPERSCLQYIRKHIINLDPAITESWKYGMPFFCYNKKMFCYCWTHKKYGQPYIGFVEGKHLDDPHLLSENRARMKILLLDPSKDLPIKRIDTLLKKAIALYK